MRPDLWVENLNPFSRDLSKLLLSPWSKNFGKYHAVDDTLSVMNSYNADQVANMRGILSKYPPMTPIDLPDLIHNSFAHIVLSERINQLGMAADLIDGKTWLHADLIDDKIFLDCIDDSIKNSINLEVKNELICFKGAIEIIKNDSIEHSDKLNTLNSLKKIDPKSFAPYLHCGCILYSMGNADAAFSEWRIAFELAGHLESTSFMFDKIKFFNEDMANDLKKLFSNNP
jgi:hypothetical protein